MDVGDEVITKRPLWHWGEDIGNRLGKIIDNTSYLLVELYNFHSNPVKLMRNEVEKVEREKTALDDWYESSIDDIGFE